MAWKFDKTIASTFDTHARQHIPDYDKVLNLVDNLCKDKLDASSPILEIGCAVGETLKRLNRLGFNNLYAVDASQDMLDLCPANLATYYCTKDFPKVNISFDAILCNWTLHFVKNKVEYLQDIYKNMNESGLFILSEKTDDSGLAKEQYYNFKLNNKVSWDTINRKEQDLKNVMFVDSVEWYLQTLRLLGFKQVYIANATWCFTTFVAIK